MRTWRCSSAKEVFPESSKETLLCTEEDEDTYGRLSVTASLFVRDSLQLRVDVMFDWPFLVSIETLLAVRI
jgi:hypothetical protein